MVLALAAGGAAVLLYGDDAPAPSVGVASTDPMVATDPADTMPTTAAGEQDTAAGSEGTQATTTAATVDATAIGDGGATTGDDGIGASGDLASLLDPASYPDTPSDPPAERLAGPPDASATAVAVAAFETSGLDLTGLDILVWPEAGTGRTQLMLAFDEAAPMVQEAGGESDTAAIDRLLGALFESPHYDALGITLVTVAYTGTDGDGPFTLVIRADANALESAYAAGTSPPQEAIRFTAIRETQ